VLRSLVIVTLSLLLATTALAQQTPCVGEAPPLPEGQTAEEAARAAFEEGTAALAGEDLERAAPLLARSLALVPAASTAFNLAGVRADQGRIVCALELYDRLLADEFEPLGEEQRGQVQELRTAAEERLARILASATGAPTVELVVDDEAVGTVSAGTEVRRDVDPGSHEVSASAPDRDPVSRTVRVSPGEVLRVQLELTPPPEPPAPLGPVTSDQPSPPAEQPPSPETDGGSKTWIFVLVGAVLAAGIAATVVGVTLASDGGLTEDTYFGNTGT
jgi:hypothetical protein